jgi:hypothetical protein
VAVGGNLGGFVTSSDPILGPWWWFSAPAAFLGDKSEYFAGTLSLDLQTTAHDSANYPLAILVGDGTALYYSAPPPGTTWTSYSVTLSPAGWREGDYFSGAQPTAARMQAVLANLTALYIDGDWLSGSEITGLDNPTLTSAPAEIPEPASLALIASGAVVFAGCRPWSRRRA